MFNLLLPSLLSMPIAIIVFLATFKYFPFPHPISAKKV